MLVNFTLIEDIGDLLVVLQRDLWMLFDVSGKRCWGQVYRLGLGADGLHVLGTQHPHRKAFSGLACEEASERRTF